jgi:hypothetical protein
LAAASQADAGPADAVLPTRGQLRILQSGAGFLGDVRPVKLLLLLRAAVLRSEPVYPWLTVLAAREAENGLVKALEDPAPAGGKGSASATTLELAGRILGFNNPDLPAFPAPDSTRYGRVAWAAAVSPRRTDRHTACLALTVLPGGLRAALPRLEDAIATLPSAARSRRRAELWSVLMDGLEGEEIQREYGRLSGGLRTNITLRRILRRLRHDGRWIALSALGSGIGAGLGLGLERLLIGSLAQSQLGVVFFALFSYWGFILMGLAGFLAAWAGSLALRPGPLRLGSTAAENRNLWGSEILLSAIGFFLANGLVAVLNGIILARAPGVFPLGLLAGLGAGLALASTTQPGKNRRLRIALSALLGTGIFVLVQVLFGSVPALGRGLSIALSGSFFEVEFEYIQLAFWQSWIQSSPEWFNTLAVIEAGLAALALLGGAVIGRSLAAEWSRRWQDLLDRMGE